jgi:hypothetical protein
VGPGLGAGNIEVKYTLYGDASLDGVVNGTDFGLLAANFGQQANGAAVELPASDWTALDSFAAANGLMADVPEPASMGLMTLGAMSVLARRRRLTS